MNKLIPIAGGSTFVYACLAGLMGVWPGMELSKIPPGPNVRPLTSLEAEGRQVYVANGCSYCHTQQVRPLEEDRVFGRPSVAGDFAYQTPELLGSERTGPDLTNIGVRQPSSVWQYIHLYNPRAVVPESIMPSFNWMFDIVSQAAANLPAVPLPISYAPAQGVVVPSHQAQALIAYLAALKQPSLTGLEEVGGQVIPQSIDRVPATVQLVANNVPVPPQYNAGKGAEIFTANCAACHQSGGQGIPGAFPPLMGDPVVNDDDAAHHIQVVLRGLHDVKVAGVAYATAMPPFSVTLSDAQIADVIDYERSSWGNHGKPAVAEQVAVERSRAP